MAKTGLVGEALVAQRPLEAELVEEVEEGLRGEVAELDPVAVLGAAGHVGRDAAAVVAERSVELAPVVELPAEEVAEVVVVRGPEQAGLDALTLPAALADDEGGEDGLNGVERRTVAGEELGEVGGTVPAGGRVVHVHAAGDGVDDALVGADVGVGAGGAETGHVGVDEAGIAGGEAVVVHAEAGGDAGTEAGDDDVGAGGEALGAGAAFLRFQVEDDAALAAVPHEGGVVLAAGVTSRRLHLHDVGAGVGENHGSQGAGEATGEVDDLQALARGRHRRFRSGAERSVCEYSIPAFQRDGPGALRLAPLHRGGKPEAC